MPDLAWLSFLRGEWLLVTGDSDSELRKWSEVHLALKELEDEGWIVTKPVSRDSEASHRRQRFLLGYCLRRTVH